MKVGLDIRISLVSVLSIVRERGEASRGEATREGVGGSYAAPKHFLGSTSPLNKES